MHDMNKGALGEPETRDMRPDDHLELFRGAQPSQSKLLTYSACSGTCSLISIVFAVSNGVCVQCQGSIPQNNEAVQMRSVSGGRKGASRLGSPDRLSKRLGLRWGLKVLLM